MEHSHTSIHTNPCATTCRLAQDSIDALTPPILHPAALPALHASSSLNQPCVHSLSRCLTATNFPQNNPPFLIQLGPTLMTQGSRCWHWTPRLVSGVAPGPPTATTPPGGSLSPCRTTDPRLCGRTRRSLRPHTATSQSVSGTARGVNVRVL